MVETRHQRYVKAQAARGVVLVAVWVPTTCKKLILEFAAACRKAGGPPSGNTGGINPPHDHSNGE